MVKKKNVVKKKNESFGFGKLFESITQETEKAVRIEAKVRKYKKTLKNVFIVRAVSMVGAIWGLMSFILIDEFFVIVPAAINSSIALSVYVASYVQEFNIERKIEKVKNGN